MKKIDLIFLSSVFVILNIFFYLLKHNLKKKLLLFFLILFFLIYTAFNFDFLFKKSIDKDNYSSGLRDILYNYKLGDSILRDNYLPVRIYYRIYFPNTIVTEYFNNTSETGKVDILHNIIKKKSEIGKIPEKDEIIFHLRIGDVIDLEYEGTIDDLLEGKKQYNYKYCNTKDYLTNYEKIDDKLKHIDKEKYKTIILIGGYHCKGNHEKSEEYVEKIRKYLISKDFSVKTRINNFSADEDFIYMSNSKIFFKTGGGYSNLISKMVELNNNIVF